MKKMKKTKKIAKVFAAILGSALLFVFASCADADGLHDQNALLVTFEFTGFGQISGTYSIPGNFDDWDNTQSDITMKKGEGSSSEIPVTTANIQFTLVPVNSWVRDWYKLEVLEGNGYDGTAGKYQNFFIDNLDLNSGSVTILIDGSSGSAIVTQK